MTAASGYEKHLLREGIVTEVDLAQAREFSTRDQVPLARALVLTGVATEEVAYRALAAYAGVRFVVPSQLAVPVETVKRVPPRFATHYDFVPVEEKNGTLVIAIADPLDTHRLDDIRTMLKQRIEAVVATPSEIARAKKALYGVGADTVERMLNGGEYPSSVVSLDRADLGTDLGDASIDPSVIKFVNELLAEAIGAGATDVHLEPFEESLRVRYRVDGILHQVPTPPSIRGFHSAIVSRIKIMANLNIAEKRLPQDGKLQASLGADQFDLRVSILPTPHGETVNLRILNRSSMFLTLDQLGFLPEDLSTFDAFLARPHGMILLTGPTGSGKTTTLYAALGKLNDIDRKIITIEDPIEYQMPGISQMQVLPQIGFDFARALRSMLRHDPDIMLVGEIRDYETAEMAIRASLTGHLVFSTLHTNDAAGAVMRLTDMGVEPFLIASTMIASVAQRLVRRVCTRCAEAYCPEPEALHNLGVAPEDAVDARFRRGMGCDACRQTGYSGRVAIYEMLPFSRAIRDLTVQRATSTLIKRKGCELGMKTLRQTGWERVKSGVTTIEEVLRVTAELDLEDSAADVSNAPVPL